MTRSKHTNQPILPRLIASPIVKALGDIVLLLLLMLSVFTVMFLLACFSDTDGYSSDDTSSSSSEGSESGVTTGFDPGSHETPDLTDGETTGSVDSGSDAGSSSDGSSSDGSTEGGTSAPETTSAGTTTTTTTTAPVSPWYKPCTQNIDCEAPLRCYTSTIGKGHCAGYCEEHGNCEPPTSGNVAPWCWTLNPAPYDGICWLFRAAVSCAFIECPDGLVCYELYDQGTKAACAAP